MREVLPVDAERSFAPPLAADDADSGVGDGETGCVLPGQVRAVVVHHDDFIPPPGIRASNTADVRSMNAARLMRSLYVGATSERKGVGRTVMPR